MTKRAVSKQQMGGQLKMFMTPKEIMATHDVHWPDMAGYVLPNNPTAGDVMAVKRMEAEVSGHADAIRRGEGGVEKLIHLSTESEGVDYKVHKDRPGIVGGQHRISVLLEHDPEKLLPVVYHKDIKRAMVESPNAPRTRWDGMPLHRMPGWRGRKDYPYDWPGEE